MQRVILGHEVYIVGLEYFLDTFRFRFELNYKGTTFYAIRDDRGDCTNFRVYEKWDTEVLFGDDNWLTYQNAAQLITTVATQAACIVFLPNP